MAGACVPPETHGGFSVKISKVWVPFFFPVKWGKNNNGWTGNIWDYVF